jgi:ribosomal protein L10
LRIAGSPRFENGAGIFSEVNLPTQAKVDRVSELKEKLERCSIAVSTNYAGIGVNDMTDLRRRMRDAGVEFTVVKNNLMKLACDASQRSQAKSIVEGPTAIAFGYDDPTAVPKPWRNSSEPLGCHWISREQSWVKGCCLQPT